LTHTSSWHNAIAHIDADCFFASCELMRRPDLRGRPLCVLSSQDACVIAKTYDAKAMGIRTGMPVWEARRLLPRATYLSADFRFYGQLSGKMFSIFRRYSPQVEAYSIDEGFMDMNGLRTLWRKSFRALADELRERVYAEIGITVSVGISTTKTLAKIASEMNKPNGSTLIAGRRIRRFLAEVPLGDIPGIGRNRGMLLHQFNMVTALDFCTTERAIIHRLLGRVGSDLWDELNGTPVFALAPESGMPKSISRTASLGCVTMERSLIIAHLSYHLMRVVTELVRRRLTASRFSLFLRLKTFDAVSGTVRMDPCNDMQRLNQVTRTLFQDLFVQGCRYRGCGITVSNLMPDARQGNLFEIRGGRGDQLQLIRTMDAINGRYGSQAIKPARAIKKSHNSIRFKYPVLKVAI